MIIYLLFLFLVFYFYGKKNHSMVLFFITAIITGGFGVLPGESGIQKTDLILVFALFVTANERSHDKSYFCIKNDIIARCIFFILIFLTIEFLFTVVLMVETPVWSLKVVRLQFLLLLYFYFRRIDSISWNKYFKIALSFSFLQGILYYLQLVGITGILTKEIDEDVANIRYSNFPLLTLFFIVYFLVNKGVDGKFRLFMLFFWGMMIILSQNRGALLGLIGAFTMFVISQRNKKSFIYLVAGIAVYFILIGPMLARRDVGERASTRDDLTLLINSDAEDMSKVKGTQVGTVAFRFGMLAERWMYLVENPQYMLFGVGCIHEQSPSNRFRFFLGTHNDNFFWGICMIESGDIVWVPILLRYGIAGIIIFLLMLICWVKLGYKSINKVKNSVARASCLMSICILISSFGGPLYDSVNTITLFTIYLGMLMSDPSNCSSELLKCNSINRPKFQKKN